MYSVGGYDRPKDDWNIRELLKESQSFPIGGQTVSRRVTCTASENRRTLYLTWTHSRGQARAALAAIRLRGVLELSDPQKPSTAFRSASPIRNIITVGQVYYRRIVAPALPVGV